MGHINKDQQWFEEKVKEYHGNKVEVLSEYQGSVNPIDIVYHCEKHGNTYKTLNAKNICKDYFNPCKACEIGNKSKSRSNGNNDKDFYLDRLQKYCTSKGGKLLSNEWITAKTLYEIDCGNIEHIPFWNNADKLINNKQWCPYCSGREGDFEKIMNETIQNKNGKLLSHYENSRNHVSVLCKEHNYEWDIMPLNIQKGRWCPVCSLPYSEKVVWDYLNMSGFNIRVQYVFDDLKGEANESLRYDFAILKNNKLLYIIEVDDEEHESKTKTNIKRVNARKRDLVKNKYCEENNIPLYRMKVPFKRAKKWDYNEYYNYIEKDLHNLILILKNKIA